MLPFLLCIYAIYYAHSAPHIWNAVWYCATIKLSSLPHSTCVDPLKHLKVSKLLPLYVIRMFCVYSLHSILIAIFHLSQRQKNREHIWCKPQLRENPCKPRQKGRLNSPKKITHIDDMMIHNLTKYLVQIRLCL